MLYGYTWKTQGKPWEKVERVSAERCLELHSSNVNDPVTGTKLRRRLKEEGRPLRSGRWLPGEDDILVENLHNYHKDYPDYNPILLLNSTRSNMREKRRIVKETSYNSRIAAGLNRAISDANIRLKYFLFPDYVTRKGKFTLQETMQIKNLYQKYGSKWKAIGTMLGRSEGGLLTRWRNLQANKFGLWDETEDYLLTEAIKQYVDNTECADKGLHNSLPWTIIAKAVPGRNIFQCRAHWMFKLRNRVFHEENLFDNITWDNDQKVVLLTQICKQEVMHEEDVDFDIIRKHFEDGGFVVSREQIRRQWQQLKKKVTNYFIKSFEEILDEVSELVVACVTDT